MDDAQSNFSYKIIKAMMRGSNPPWIIPHITVGCSTENKLRVNFDSHY